MGKVVKIMLGGPADLLPEDWAEDKEAIWIGVDHGAFRLVEAGITPRIAIGDFDSVNPSEFEMIKKVSDEIIEVASDKDDTDTQLALVEAFVHKDVDNVYLYGGSGGRIDHMLNIFYAPLEERFEPFTENITLIDKHNTLNYYLPGHHTVKKEFDKAYLSFGAVVPVKNLTLKNTKYVLDEKDIPMPFMYSSNEFLDGPAEFSFTDGVVVVIQSKD